MNADRLRRLADHLEQSVDDAHFNPAISISPCGTIAGVAGHTVLLFGSPVRTSITAEALSLLGAQRGPKEWDALVEFFQFGELRHSPGRQNADGESIAHAVTRSLAINELRYLTAKYDAKNTAPLAHLGQQESK